MTSPHQSALIPGGLMRLLFGGLVPPSTPPVVPTDEDVFLLLHCDGDDESTDFPDSATGGNAPHTVSANGNAQVDTSEKWAGTGSALLDGVGGDTLSVPSDSDLNFGIADAPNTIEGRIRTNDVASVSVLLNRHGGGANDWNLTDGHSYLLQWQNTSSELFFYFNSAGAAASVKVAAANFGDEEWHHFAVSYDGTTTRIFWEGDGGTTSTADYSQPATPGDLVLGHNVATGGDTVSGRLDEIRGLHRGEYTEDFDPPVGPFSS